MDHSFKVQTIESKYFALDISVATLKKQVYDLEQNSNIFKNQKHYQNNSFSVDEFKSRIEGQIDNSNKRINDLCQRMEKIVKITQTIQVRFQHALNNLKKQIKQSSAVKSEYHFDSNETPSNKQSFEVKNLNEIIDQKDNNSTTPIDTQQIKQHVQNFIKQQMNVLNQIFDLKIQQNINSIKQLDHKIDGLASIMLLPANFVQLKAFQASNHDINSRLTRISQQIQINVQKQIRSIQQVKQSLIAAFQQKINGLNDKDKHKSIVRYEQQRSKNPIEKTQISKQKIELSKKLQNIIKSNNLTEIQDKLYSQQIYIKLNPQQMNQIKQTYNEIQLSANAHKLCFKQIQINFQELNKVQFQQVELINFGYLEISSNQLKIFLANISKTFPNLKIIDLSYCELNDNHWKAIVENIDKSTKIQAVNLYLNEISQVKKEDLQGKLSVRLPLLKYLNLQFNSLNKQSRVNMKNFSEKNKTIDMKY